MSVNRHPARKKFTRFASKVPFEFGLPNVGPAHVQKSDGSPIYFTRATSLLRRQALANAKGVQIKSDSFHPRVLPRDAWAKTDWHAKKVLFLIPDDALGDCVGMALFLRALRQHYPELGIGVLNSASATDIFATVPGISIFQLFISSKQMGKFDELIDLSEMEGWDTIAEMPVNPEEALCKAFDIAPIPLGARAVAKENTRKIGIVPMASSPLRTLPPKLVSDIAKRLAQSGYDVTLTLNAYQGVMQAYKQALDLSGISNIRILDGFRTIGGLLEFVQAQDYIIVADSGPAHISKLFQTPGVAIYTSASASVLQGRHKNLTPWQSSFQGDFCTAPCGLAKLRATDDGRVGCMGSLGVRRESLGELPTQSDRGLAQKLTVDSPVPCVSHLFENQRDILDLIASDLGV
ncbi:lipopolysaccharide heptosyltransferase family protein [Thalassospira sp. MA62]|nr:lipopolysaccharide heptosyltransferase family protein [Thalassospira sp. MA62]